MLSDAVHRQARPGIRRVASTVTEEARAVAWLHEVLEWTAVAERERSSCASRAMNYAPSGL